MAPARKSTNKTATRKTRSKAAGRKAPAKASKKASARKSASKKATSRKAAPKKSAPKKKTASKAAPKKKAAAKAAPAKGKAKAKDSKAPKSLKASKAAQPEARGGRRAPAIRSRKKKQPHVKPPALEGTPSALQSKLGNKWACYGCGAKFYDLNQPEPLCPRCGADQREKPKDAPTPPPPRSTKREPRSLAPYLDDDDAATRNESLTSDDLELDLGGVSDDEAVDKSPTLGLDKPEEAADED
jgi:rubrerythrin